MIPAIDVSTRRSEMQEAKFIVQNQIGIRVAEISLLTSQLARIHYNNWECVAKDDSISKININPSEPF